MGKGKKGFRRSICSGTLQSNMPDGDLTKVGIAGKGDEARCCGVCHALFLHIAKGGRRINLCPVLSGYQHRQLTEGTVQIQLTAFRNFFTTAQIYRHLSEADLCSAAG